MSAFLNGHTFHVVTFGCQMNKHDSERIVGMLESLGAVNVADIPHADIVVYMTCCVREAADVRLYGQVASMKNIPIREGSPLQERIVAIGGCIGQRDGELLAKRLDNVNIVFGTNNLGSLPKLIGDALEEGRTQVETLEQSDGFPTSLPTHRESYYQAWLPIMIGCNNFCSYCIVPYVRGREKSRPFEEIINEAKGYIDSGVKEITLLGQNVNSYGNNGGDGHTFADVLRAIDGLGVSRLRFATSHPKDLSDEVISLFGELPSLMPYLHLPVQSGSDRILREMNRRYTREHYLGLVHKIREKCPDIALSTDIIVGFPGETEADFKETYDLVREVGYSQVFTFIYSPREGTPAALLPQNSSKEEIQDRFDRLVELVQKKAYEANQVDAKSRVEMLVEGVSKRDEMILSGKSKKNQTVHAPIPEGHQAGEFIGRFVEVQIEEAKTWYLRGTCIS